jgi:alanyl-tRNA synthetase
MKNLEAEIQRLLAKSSERAKAQFRLSAEASEQEIDTAIHEHLCTTYGLPINATNEQIAQKMHEVRCAKFGLDPATTTEQELDAHSAALTIKHAA